MKPYYEHAGITIYHGDCREVLGCLPVAFCRACGESLSDESMLSIHLAAGHDVGPSFDLLCTDPPYGLGAARRNFGGNGVKRHMTGILAGKCVPKRDYGNAGWDDQPADLEALTQAIKRTNWQIIFGGNYDERVHPTQKPVAVMHWAIRQVMEGFSSVLDPWMGSGTTLVAAKTLGKSGTGIEIEEKYCEIAAKRLSQEVFQF